MISWIVASHDQGILEANLLDTLPLDGGSRWWADEGAPPSVEGHRSGADEVLIVRGARSMAEAYNLGQRYAMYPVRAYVHHDVRILDLLSLRMLLGGTCTPEVGLVGVIGARNPHIPFWEPAAEPIGSVIDSRMGRIDFGGHGPAAFVDGLLLATAHDLVWDEGIPGWHMYDADQCLTQVAAGRPNYVLQYGEFLVQHCNGNPTDVNLLQGWAEAVAALNAKWFL
jgi:hypothetical protein